MEIEKNKRTLKRLRNRYRISVTNEDTFEEIANFKITRIGVSFFFTFLLIIIMGMTVALIAFTPLKFYVPGYQAAGEPGEYEQLMRKTDSLENAVRMQQQYTEGIKKMLSGEAPERDTVPDAGGE